MEAPCAPPNPSTLEAEPMQLGRAPLTPAEGQRRLQQLCLYCGEVCHLIRSCPNHPAQCPSSQSQVGVLNSVSRSVAEMVVCASLSWPGNHLLHRAAGNFPLEPLTRPLRVHGVDGSSLSAGCVLHQTCPITLQVGAIHTKQIRFLILPIVQDGLILGHPWLQQHNPPH